MSEPFLSQSINIRHLSLGGRIPVRLQSMTNTDTNDVEASVDQCRKMIRAGAQLIRLTTQGNREVENLGKIIQQLRDEDYDTPIVADIHFNPSLALTAAKVADKVRINPGNYLKGQSVDTLLPALLETCNRFGTAIRIGVNHGSLDESLLNQYGDTPLGMVESAMQFLRVCNKYSFDKVVVSLKSSNPRVMVQSVRLMVHTMVQEGMCYPVHLGVTEAGDGMEGRIKSAVGIAPLLLEGVGDTIRVSLTEPPEEELPVAAELVQLFPKPARLPYHPFQGLAWDPFDFKRRSSRPVAGIGKGAMVKLVSQVPPEPETDLIPAAIEHLTVTYEEWLQHPELLEGGDRVFMLERGDGSIQEVKQQLNHFCAENSTAPILYKWIHHTREHERFSLQLAGELGFLLVDGTLDGVWVENNSMYQALLNETLLMVLQAGRARISKTEYIACPSCGRTHFDIQARLKEIRRATSHLTTLKIGVMGCIVNGPGEMADAHYGYVGAGKGLVSLYKGRELIQRSIPEKEAVEALIDLIKREGDWIDPS